MNKNELRKSFSFKNTGFISLKELKKENKNYKRIDQVIPNSLKKLEKLQNEFIDKEIVSKLISKRFIPVIS